MAKPKDTISEDIDHEGIDHEDIGRFDHSFVVLLVRDFFLVLVLVSAVELGIRYGLLLHEFETEQKAITTAAAERLASDVKDLMLNSGGPVAARTLYPILKRNHDARDLVISVEPSAVTVSSIKKIFKFTPKGIPAIWPDGRHHAHTVEIRAEKFCLRCHGGAKVGDALGSVTVRNYFSTHIDRWLDQAELTGAMSIGNTVLRAMILFFMLRIRMAGLLSLQSVISRLSRAGSDISHRAKIKSKDEFGALARDLNLFLDRLNHIIDDMCTLLGKVSLVNTQLSETRGRIGRDFQAVELDFTNLSHQVFSAGETNARSGGGWYQAVGGVMAALKDAPAGVEGLADLETKLTEMEQEYEATMLWAQAVSRANAGLGSSLTGVTSGMQELSRSLSEIAILEEKMQSIAELGQTMVDRLRHDKTDSGGAQAAHEGLV